MQPSDLTYKEQRRLARIRQELARDRQAGQSHTVGLEPESSVPFPIRRRNREDTPLQKRRNEFPVPFPISGVRPDDLIPPAAGKAVSFPARRPPVPAIRVGPGVSWCWVYDTQQGWIIAQDASPDRRYDPITQYARERTLRARSAAKQVRSTAARDGYRRRRERKARVQSLVGQVA